MAVGGDNVLPLVQQCLQLGVEVQAHTLSPCLARVGHFRAVEIEFEDIVVRVNQIKVCLQVGSRQFHIAPHIQVAVFLTPVCAHIAQSVASPGSFPPLPIRGIEPRLGPVVARLLVAGVGTLPGGFVGHGYDRLQDAAVGSHPSVCHTVDSEQPLQRLLVVRPVAGRAVGQMVVRRPDAEIRVADNEWHRRYSELCCLIRFKQFGCLRHRCHADNGQQSHSQ